MVLNRQDFSTFHNRLYAGVGCLETVTLLKRGDDQNQGTVTAYTIFNARWERFRKSGQSLAGSMSSNHTRGLHIPQSEMCRIGILISNINVLDRFVDKECRVWQPESPETLTVQLLAEHLCIQCKRLS